MSTATASLDWLGATNLKVSEDEIRWRSDPVGLGDRSALLFSDDVRITGRVLSMLAVRVFNDLQVGKSQNISEQIVKHKGC